MSDTANRKFDRPSILGLVGRCLVDDSGATSIEYAMLASGVALAIIATVFSFGSQLKTTFYDKLAAML
jgi:pilus assembly protein Flp/PilA